MIEYLRDQLTVVTEHLTAHRLNQSLLESTSTFLTHFQQQV